MLGWQPSDILALLARGQPSESLVLLILGQLKEISVLLPLIIYPPHLATLQSSF